MTEGFPAPSPPSPLQQSPFEPLSRTPTLPFSPQLGARQGAVSPEGLSGPHPHGSDHPILARQPLLATSYTLTPFYLGSGSTRQSSWLTFSVGKVGLLGFCLGSHQRALGPAAPSSAIHR